MIVKRGKGDFHTAYRPCRISEVIGQEEAKKLIKKSFDDRKLANCLIFYGADGTGKTTFSRIIMLGLNCEKGPTTEKLLFLG